MQDGSRCNPSLRALATWSGSIAGVMLILVGGLIPSAFIIPGQDFPQTIIGLPITWQVTSLLISALVCGPRAAVMASIAYITIGLLHLPIFNGGGGLAYLTYPGFGYLTGFIPAAWISGRLTEERNIKNLISLTLCAFAGVIVLQIWGGMYLLIGSSFNKLILNSKMFHVQLSFATNTRLSRLDK